MSMRGIASIPCRSPGCARAFGSTLGRDTHEGQQHGHVFNVQIVGKPRRKPTRRTAPSRATKVSRNGRARRTPARALVTLKMDEDDARKLLAILGEEAFGIDDLAIADVEVIEESAYRHGLYARIRRQLEAQTA